MLATSFSSSEFKTVHFFERKNSDLFQFKTVRNNKKTAESKSAVS